MPGMMRYPLHDGAVLTIEIDAEYALLSAPLITRRAAWLDQAPVTASQLSELLLAGRQMDITRWQDGTIILDRLRITEPELKQIAAGALWQLVLFSADVPVTAWAVGDGWELRIG